MADTTLIIDGKIVTLNDYTIVNNSIIDEVKKLSQSISVKDTTAIYTTIPHYMPAIFLTVLVLYILIKVRSVLLYRDKNTVSKSIVDTDSTQNIDTLQCTNYSNKSKDYYLYKGSQLELRHQEIEAILNKYFIYYRNLDRHLQFKFFDRIIKFMYSKNFLIYSNEPFKEMPVLISAAAVQISFGLEEYELPHYNYIRVHKEEYFADNSLRVLAGNVQDDCITLAWNQLLKGYYDYEDGNNVGLHEMAHALYFQEIVAEKNVHIDFENHFNELMVDGEGVLRQKQCPYRLYSDYAFTNLQEFWAVSVELFFERATHLQTAYPKVYTNLQNILKQNPLITNQPV